MIRFSRGTEGDFPFFEINESTMLVCALAIAGLSEPYGKPLDDSSMTRGVILLPEEFDRLAGALAMLEQLADERLEHYRRRVLFWMRLDRPATDKRTVKDVLEQPLSPGLFSGMVAALKKGASGAVH